MRRSIRCLLRAVAKAPRQPLAYQLSAPSEAVQPIRAVAPSAPNFVTRTFHLPTLGCDYKLKVTERVLLRIEREGIEAYLFKEAPAALGPAGLKLQSALRDTQLRGVEPHQPPQTSAEHQDGRTSSSTANEHLDPLTEPLRGSEVDTSPSFAAVAPPPNASANIELPVPLSEATATAASILAERYGSPVYRRLPPSAILVWHYLQQVQAFDAERGGVCLRCLDYGHTADQCEADGPEHATHDRHGLSVAAQGDVACFPYHLYGHCSACTSTAVHGACVICNDAHPAYEHLPLHPRRPHPPSVLPAWPMPVPPPAKRPGAKRPPRDVRLRLEQEHYELELRRETIMRRLFTRYERRAEHEAEARAVWDAAGRPELDMLPQAVREAGEGIDVEAVRARIPDERYIRALRQRHNYARKQQQSRSTSPSTPMVHR